MGPAKIRPPASRSHSWISYEIRAQEALACSLGQEGKVGRRHAGLDGRGAIARVRSCSRGGRLAMRSGFSDPAPPAAQPQRLCREVCDRLELELAHSAGAIPVRRASRYPRHRSGPAQLTPAGPSRPQRASPRVVPISGTELSPASRSMPNPVHPKMTGLRAAPDKIRDRSLEFHPRCAQRNMPLEALRTGRRAPFSWYSPWRPGRSSRSAPADGRGARCALSRPSRSAQRPPVSPVRRARDRARRRPRGSPR